MKEYTQEIVVSSEDIDLHNHVNNLVYIQWMINIATEHSNICGCTDTVYAQNKAWIIREHNIRYLSSAILGDTVVIRTYPESFEKFKCRRIYEMTRKSDHKKLVSAWSDWVLFDMTKNRPALITTEIINFFS